MSFALVCTGIKLLYVRPLAAETDALKHALLAKQPQNVRRDALVFDVQEQLNVLFSRKTQCILEEGDSHALKPIAHPAACIAQAQIVVVARFDITDSIGQPLQDAVVVQHNPSVQGPSYIDLDDVASHQSGLLQRLQGILWHVLIRRSMAKQVDTLNLNICRMRHRQGRRR